MTKPIIKDSFSVEDIHRLREYHYESTKNMTKKERIKEINDKAEEFEREMLKRKAKRVVV